MNFDCGLCVWKKNVWRLNRPAFVPVNYLLRYPLFPESLIGLPDKYLMKIIFEL